MKYHCYALLSSLSLLEMMVDKMCAGKSRKVKRTFCPTTSFNGIFNSCTSFLHRCTTGTWLVLSFKLVFDSSTDGKGYMRTMSMCACSGANLLELLETLKDKTIAITHIVDMLLKQCIRHKGK